ncbi:selenocysteine lyase/cysteine desulfurase [Paenarthrobacter nicotinovorans]|uniref:Selenocysteine lyase/cysteine desulfurase n=1 Tax=Paenarthrobacter nicotinovorans TaxID=29320 RepID=A0ABT9TP38_PAENI|nr:hypothetical protein [Paenarthrobacter nicotinovorans]MDQ0103004.1 selenocysteine lyase/cysteine desulfurase [Paenarthrobacter nicotinovorans]
MNTNDATTKAAVIVDDGDDFRAQFPVLTRKVHLASNARGAMSTHVLDSYHAYLDRSRLIRLGGSSPRATPNLSVP